MEANQLLAEGNCVSYLGKFYRIIDIYGRMQKYCIANGLTVHRSQIKGIKLTPEILEKCGMAFTKGFYRIKRLRFSYEHNELSQFVRFHYSGKVAYIQYLHQLQNLYYLLTSEELDVKL